MRATHSNPNLTRRRTQGLPLTQALTLTRCDARLRHMQPLRQVRRTRRPSHRRRRRARRVPLTLTLTLTLILILTLTLALTLALTLSLSLTLVRARRDLRILSRRVLGR